ncbi:MULTISPECIES: HAD-IIA family hydrolase [unclassified Gordonia (in: high G+C Gram-positive bacteria)]|uniref:HAD-IIA family hydrolase n=1 Tax=unclassified Gordonia (in: high G+C Gram-positive bacteria) TaxID=2657482 RepID=UPI00071CA626|nr:MULTISPECIES: HAD-IIA family hydrolase [unclassified Gordonia (in: high G+C Gram-positive bacteria)]KSU55748.1 HAD family hydrolase [Gordonia sp. SGD-V-85]MBN0973655.1 HAD-IIA family hydrolase [Gordonia sp. BP-119]MBN0983537.1 HAD-IIA family hydrolase [Gordonia sp. BP-94]
MSDRDRPRRDGRGQRDTRGQRDGGRGGRNDRPGRDRGSDRGSRQPGPPLPEDIAASDLDPEVRRDLLTLDKANAEIVARHLVMVSRILLEDPVQALEHARAARARASRVGVVRETVGIAAYNAGEWQESATELRAAKRITGNPALLPLIADCERGLGRPERAVEIARGDEGRSLTGDDATEMRIVEAGARMDLGEPEKAVVTLQAENLKPGQIGTGPARLFYAYASALEAAGRRDDAITWFMNAAAADVDDVTDAEFRLTELANDDQPSESVGVNGAAPGELDSPLSVPAVERDIDSDADPIPPASAPAPDVTPAIDSPAASGAIENDTIEKDTIEAVPGTADLSQTSDSVALSAVAEEGSDPGDDVIAESTIVEGVPNPLATLDESSETESVAETTTASPSDSVTLVDRHDALLLDLDGTVFAGHHALPNALDALARLNIPRFFVTNNASRRPSEVAEHLRELGFEATDDLVVTSAQSGARLLSEHLEPGSRALVIGTDGLAQEVREVGVGVTRSADDRPAAVIQGHSPDTGWAQLSEAALAIRAGALWIATNIDATLPSERGLLVGNGSMVAALRNATGKDPMVAGKPAAPLMADAIARARASAPLVVGDRLDTDIEGGHAVGIESALVLTGVSTVDDLLSAPPEQRPTYVLDDLAGLFVDIDAVRVSDQPGWDITVEGSTVRVAGSGADAGLVPALAAATWAAVDAGSADPDELRVIAEGAARTKLESLGVTVVG